MCLQAVCGLVKLAYTAIYNNLFHSCQDFAGLGWRNDFLSTFSALGVSICLTGNASNWVGICDLLLEKFGSSGSLVHLPEQTPPPAPRKQMLALPYIDTLSQAL